MFKDDFATAAAFLETASEDLALKEKALEEANAAQSAAQSARDDAKNRRDEAVARVKEIADQA